MQSTEIISRTWNYIFLVEEKLVVLKMKLDFVPPKLETMRDWFHNAWWFIFLLKHEPKDTVSCCRNASLFSSPDSRGTLSITLHDKFWRVQYVWKALGSSLFLGTTNANANAKFGVSIRHLWTPLPSYNQFAQTQKNKREGICPIL